MTPGEERPARVESLVETVRARTPARILTGSAGVG
jgi:hypothetical protein